MSLIKHYLLLSLKELQVKFYLFMLSMQYWCLSEINKFVVLILPIFDLSIHFGIVDCEVYTLSLTHVTQISPNTADPSLNFFGVSKFILIK